MRLFEVEYYENPKDNVYINTACITNIVPRTNNEGDIIGSIIRIHGTLEYSFYDRRTPKELFEVLESL